MEGVNDVRGVVVALPGFRKAGGVGGVHAVATETVAADGLAVAIAVAMAGVALDGMTGVSDARGTVAIAEVTLDGVLLTIRDARGTVAIAATAAVGFDAAITAVATPTAPAV